MLTCEGFIRNGELFMRKEINGSERNEEVGK